MKYKQLGQDLKISAIGLGAMPLSLTGRPSEPDATAKRSLRDRYYSESS